MGATGCEHNLGSRSPPESRSRALPLVTSEWLWTTTCDGSTPHLQSQEPIGTNCQLTFFSLTTSLSLSFLPNPKNPLRRFSVLSFLILSEL
jgi:hypothetical protein